MVILVLLSYIIKCVKTVDERISNKLDGFNMPFDAQRQTSDTMKIAVRRTRISLSIL